MNNTQIFKLIFLHDQRLDELADRGAGIPDKATLEDFMKPDPTYSKLYFSGTDLEKEQFGLSTLQAFPRIIEAIQTGLGAEKYHTASDEFNSLAEAIDTISVGDVIIIGDEADQMKSEIATLHLDDNSNVGHLKSELREFLQNDCIVIYKEKAHDGFDLHFFSKKNIYTRFFHNLQNLLPDAFRFFSINGKRMRSERFFYFETWTLAQPPHGFEEVYPESVL
jgi:hypothetical protein